MAATQKSKPFNYMPYGLVVACSPQLLSTQVKGFHTILTSPTHRPVFSKRLLDDSGLEIKHFIVQAGQTLPSHWAPKQITLICLEGTGIFTANEQQTNLKPDINIVMSPQLLHGIQAHSDCHLLLLLCQDSPK